MTLNQEQLEWIVAEVVRRLRANAAPVAAPSTTLLLNDRLITLETLRDKLNGVASVQVAASAIVTPAVIDLLKDKQVQLVRG